tara:strand:+ start:201 stop:431 length:231 start_codon:yes stop_codon:yes gene_type:complete
MPDKIIVISLTIFHLEISTKTAIVKAVKIKNEVLSPLRNITISDAKSTNIIIPMWRCDLGKKNIAIARRIGTSLAK